MTLLWGAAIKLSVITMYFDRNITWIYFWEYKAFLLMKNLADTAQIKTPLEPNLNQHSFTQSVVLIWSKLFGNVSYLETRHVDPNVVSLLDQRVEKTYIEWTLGLVGILPRPLGLLFSWPISQHKLNFDWSVVSILTNYRGSVSVWAHHLLHWSRWPITPISIIYPVTHICGTNCLIGSMCPPLR